MPFSAEAQAIAGMENVPNHKFEARDPRRELFEAPPPEIGTPISADSSLLQGKNAWSPSIRIPLVLTLTFIGLYVPIYLTRNQSMDSSNAGIIIGVLIG